MTTATASKASSKASTRTRKAKAPRGKVGASRTPSKAQMEKDAKGIAAAVGQSALSGPNAHVTNVQEKGYDPGIPLEQRSQAEKEATAAALSSPAPEPAKAASKRATSKPAAAGKPRATRSKADPKQDAKALTMRKGGKTLKEIAEHFKWKYTAQAYSAVKRGADAAGEKMPGAKVARRAKAGK